MTELENNKDGNRVLDTSFHYDKVFLATTALEDFWDITKPIVFLGDWCLRYSRRSVWENLNKEVLDGIWKDKRKFHDAYLYLQEIYELLLKQMAELLDEVHEEHHNIRYWRIIIGPWLFHYLDVLYDRYLCIEQAMEKYKYYDTIILNEESFVTPRSTLEFVLLSVDDPYNLQIYSRILSAKECNFKKKSYNLTKSEDQNISKNNILKNIKRKIITKFMHSIALADANKSVYLVDPYFSNKSIIKLFLKTKGKVKPIFTTEEKLPDATPNQNMRNCFKNISLNNDKFQKIIANYLAYDIPYVFLESYKMIKKESFNYPSKPKAIVSWVSWYFDEKFKIWAAIASEAGSSLYGVQHGGTHGIDKYMQSMDHEIAITDKYYSWGWNYPEFHERIVPMPASKIIGRNKFKKNKNNNRILFAGNAFPRYLYRLQYPTNNHMKKYCDYVIKFIKSVNLAYQKFINYRAFIQDYGLDIVKRIQNTYPDLVMEDWDIPFQESLMNCKLFVCDHLGTVHAEALSLNVPTILFWDTESIINRTEVNGYFSNLNATGILHYSPESAANKVSEVYDNVDDWWSDRERQSARLEFCDKFAKISPNAIDEWSNELNKISRRI